MNINTLYLRFAGPLNSFSAFSNSILLAVSNHMKDTNRVGEFNAWPSTWNMDEMLSYLIPSKYPMGLCGSRSWWCPNSVKQGYPSCVCDALALGWAIMATNIFGTCSIIGQTYWIDLESHDRFQ